MASARTDGASTPILETGTVPDGLYKVRVEHGQFRTASGANRTYSLYIPESTKGLPAGPYPLVVLLHGFLMTGHQHSGNAQNFARHGFIAFTPDLTKVLLGDDTREQNVQDVLEEVRWLTNQKENPEGPLRGLVDPNRVGIAGNSAGAAVSLEVLLEAQKTAVPIKAICSLDGVPWDRTSQRMSKLKPVRMLSLRAEPALCNFHGRILNYLAMMNFKADDVKINGARHCDVENPTTIGCRCICGSSSEKYRRIFQHLTYLFFRDALDGPSLDGKRETFSQAVHSYEHGGQVVAKLDQAEPPALASTEQTQ